MKAKKMERKHDLFAGQVQVLKLSVVKFILSASSHAFFYIVREYLNVC